MEYVTGLYDARTCSGSATAVFQLVKHWPRSQGGIEVVEEHGKPRSKPKPRPPKAPPAAVDGAKVDGTTAVAGPGAVGKKRKLVDKQQQGADPAAPNQATVAVNGADVGKKKRQRIEAPAAAAGAVAASRASDKPHAPKKVYLLVAAAHRISFWSATLITSVQKASGFVDKDRCVGFCRELTLAILHVLSMIRVYVYTCTSMSVCQCLMIAPDHKLTATVPSSHR